MRWSVLVLGAGTEITEPDKLEATKPAPAGAGVQGWRRHPFLAIDTTLVTLGDSAACWGFTGASSTADLDSASTARKVGSQPTWMF